MKHFVLFPSDVSALKDVKVVFVVGMYPYFLTM